MKRLVVLFLVIMPILNGFSQVGIGTDLPNEKSVLHVDAPARDKGILIPRMTQLQRDANISPGSTENGLMIFNTDENCYNYYQAVNTTWLSLCGSYRPAVYTVDCSKIKVFGTYTEGTSLNPNNYISVSVTVTSVGAYHILAKTTNGYYFEKEGVFPNTGTFMVTLSGSGTPSTGGAGHQDAVTFDFNGTTEACTDNPVLIDVKGSQISYSISCGDPVINGDYLAGVVLDYGTNTVTIPLTNVDTGGQVIINTSSNNGISFMTTENITTSSTSITLYGTGTPVSAGSYTYTFVTNGANPQTCTFTINFDTSKGTFADPADRCFDIYSLGKRTDGEYWIKQSSANAAPVKTFCDMTNGGYTLVWSYSELTAYNIYPGTGMAVSGAYRLNQDVPLNNITTEAGGSINYNNFRLPLSAMTNINTQSSSLAPLRVRITNNATDVVDNWSRQNYIVFSPVSDRPSPISTTTEYFYFYPTSGKVFNQVITITHNPDTRTYAGATLGDAAFYAGGSSGFSNHINIGNSISSNNNAFISPDGTNTLLPSNLNNIFGYFGETEVNHHFGKCGGVSGDETSFSTQTCAAASLYPHTSINNGEGRILQWFVK